MCPFLDWKKGRRLPAKGEKGDMKNNKKENRKNMMRLGCLVLAGVFILSLVGTLLLQIAA
jgi:hypothetical protein